MLAIEQDNVQFLSTMMPETADPTLTIIWDTEKAALERRIKALEDYEDNLQRDFLSRLDTIETDLLRILTHLRLKPSQQFIRSDTSTSPQCSPSGTTPNLS